MATSASGDPAPVAAALGGLRVALARAAEEFNSPAPRLREFGAEVVYYPCLEMLPPDNLAELDRSLHDCCAGDFDWLLFTTASSVIAVAERIQANKLEPRKLKTVRIAAYGSNTRAAVHDLLHFDEIVPETHSHQELARAMRLTPGMRVLLPLPAGARVDWAGLLSAYKAQVVPVVAYRAVMGQGGHELPAMLWSGDVDVIAFTSENNVRYFAQRLKYEGGSLAMLDGVLIACIDPQTAAAARALGLRVAIVPQHHTANALAEAIAERVAVR
jgi:uroporphyrinogen III methyltransferase/synthase